jgi:hypothetical protein
MDYTIVLNEINNNQVLILEKLSNIDKGIAVIVFLLGVSLIYFFAGNLTKVK